jgi:hypothetical protein
LPTPIYGAAVETLLELLAALVEPLRLDRKSFAIVVTVVLVTPILAIAVVTRS